MLRETKNIKLLLRRYASTDYQITTSGVLPKLPRPLTRNEEQLLFNYYEQTGDRAAFEALYLANLGLVYSIVNRFVILNTDRDDALQEGFIGIQKAIRRFDPDLGFKFSTYATWWIIQSIDRWKKNQKKLIRMPVYMEDKIIALRKVVEAFKDTHGGKFPSIKYLSDELCEEEDKLYEILGYYFYSMNSLNFSSKRQQQDDFNTDNEVGSILADEASLIEFENIVLDLSHTQHSSKLLELLDERELNIIRKRFGFDGEPQTLQQIGDEQGVSKQRINQIEKDAIKKMRQHLGAEDYQELFGD